MFAYLGHQDPQVGERLMYLDTLHLYQNSNMSDKITHTYGVHVDPIRVRPFMLEVLLKSLPQRVWNLVEADELPNSYHLSVIARCTRVQPLNYG